MKIQPLKTEVEAVIAVLQDDTYEDERAMAVAIVKAVWPEIAKRDAYAVIDRLSPDEPAMVFGVFLYKDEALKFRERMGARKGVIVSSGAKQIDRMDAIAAEAKARAKR